MLHVIASIPALSLPRKIISNIKYETDNLILNAAAKRNSVYSLSILKEVQGNNFFFIPFYLNKIINLG